MPLDGNSYWMKRGHERNDRVMNIDVMGTRKHVNTICREHEWLLTVQPGGRADGSNLEKKN